MKIIMACRLTIIGNGHAEMHAGAAPNPNVRAQITRAK